MRVDRWFVFSCGVVCGWGLAKGWGSTLLVIGAGLYALGTAVSVYERVKAERRE